MSITTTTRLITPQVAKAMLKSSPGNRNISPAYVDMLAGNWRVTHQGLLLGKNNILLDGHHRLTALVKANKPQNFMVTTDPALLTPRDLPIDKNNRRADSYTIGKSNGLVAVAKAAAMITSGLMVLSTEETAAWVAIVEPYFVELTGNGGTFQLRGVTKAPYYLAAIVRMMEGGDAEKISHIHRTVSGSKITEMSPLAASFFKQVVVEQRSLSNKEFYAKAYRLFDLKRQNNTKLPIKDAEAAYAEAQQATIAAINKITATEE